VVQLLDVEQERLLLWIQDVFVVQVQALLLVY
jgi:hypothetical protein